MRFPRIKTKTGIYLRDVLLATIFTVAGAWLIKIPFNLHYLDPISYALADFQFSDIYYSKILPHEVEVDENIILVNIGKRERPGIAEQIHLISSCSPKVLGLDIWFDGEKDTVGDNALAAEIASCDNLVALSKLECVQDDQGTHCSDPVITQPYDKLGLEGKTGFDRFISEPGQRIRYFLPTIATDVSGDISRSFAARVAELWDRDRYNELMKRSANCPADVNYEIINYKRHHFIRMDFNELLEDPLKRDLLADKIVLLGYMGNTISGVKSFEDLHVTPLNERYAGYAAPDRYGIEIQASIISTIIRGEYIDDFRKSFWDPLVTFTICLLHMLAFVYLYVKRHIWYHIAAKVLQLLSFLILVLFSIYTYTTGLNIEVKNILFPVILSMDTLYFYEGLVNVLAYFGYRSYFHQDH